jgi:hypothetical protein
MRIGIGGGPVVSIAASVESSFKKQPQLSRD